jgi:hypothetical protein
MRLNHFSTKKPMHINQISTKKNGKLNHQYRNILPRTFGTNSKALPTSATHLDPAEFGTNSKALPTSATHFAAFFNHETHPEFGTNSKALPTSATHLDTLFNQEQQGGKGCRPLLLDKKNVNR